MLIHSKNGTVHSLSGINSSISLYTEQFIATADYNTGDTFRNADTDEMYTMDSLGDIIPNLYFKPDNRVSVVVSNTNKVFGFKYVKPSSGGTGEDPRVDGIIDGTQIVGNSKLLNSRKYTDFTNSISKYQSASDPIDPNTTTDVLILTNHENAPLGVDKINETFCYIYSLFASINGNTRQIAYGYDNYNTLKVYTRIKFNDVWSDWELFGQDSFAPNGFGLGGACEVIPGNDWNNAPANGFWQTRAEGSGGATTPLNAPESGSNIVTIGWQIGHGISTYVSQYATPLGTNRLYTRSKNSVNWGAWKKISTADEVAPSGFGLGSAYTIKTNFLRDNKVNSFWGAYNAENAPQQGLLWGFNVGHNTEEQISIAFNPGKPSDWYIGVQRSTADEVIWTPMNNQGNSISPIILSTSDLNTIINPGIYYQNANANATFERNYPENLAGSLQVLKTTGSAIIQIYIPYNTGSSGNILMYFRNNANGNWSFWEAVYNKAFLDDTYIKKSYGLTNDLNLAKYINFFDYDDNNTTTQVKTYLRDYIWNTGFHRISLANGAVCAPTYVQPSQPSAPITGALWIW